MDEETAAQFIKEHKKALLKALQHMADTTLSMSEKKLYDRLVSELTSITKPQTIKLNLDDFLY